MDIQCIDLIYIYTCIYIPVYILLLFLSKTCPTFCFFQRSSNSYWPKDNAHTTKSDGSWSHRVDSRDHWNGRDWLQNCPKKQRIWNEDPVSQQDQKVQSTTSKCLRFTSLMNLFFNSHVKQIQDVLCCIFCRNNQWLQYW